MPFAVEREPRMPSIARPRVDRVFSCWTKINPPRQIALPATDFNSWGDHVGRKFLRKPNLLTQLVSLLAFKITTRGVYKSGSYSICQLVGVNRAMQGLGHFRSPVVFVTGENGRQNNLLDHGLVPERRGTNHLNLGESRILGLRSHYDVGGQRICKIRRRPSAS